MTLDQVLEVLRGCDRIILLIESPRTGCISEEEVTLDGARAALAGAGPDLPAPRIEPAGDQRVASVGPIPGR